MRNSTVRRIALPIASVVVIAIAWIAYYWAKQRDPLHWLDNADRYELLSLDPSMRVTLDPQQSTGPDPQHEFYNHDILGRVTITDSSIRKQLNDALRQGIYDANNTVGSCFNPRHGIRITHHGKTTDLIICFECRQVEVFEEGRELHGYTTTSSPQSTFDAVLVAANVPLPKPAQ
jgi:hypothetical protein